MTHAEVDGLRIGQHPLVSYLSFNSRPPAPRYSTTWNVDDILTFLSNLPDNAELPLQMLAHKLAMLLALSRCSDLIALDLNFRQYCSNGVVFTIPG